MLLKYHVQVMEAISVPYRTFDFSSTLWIVRSEGQREVKHKSAPDNQGVSKYISSGKS